MSLWIKVPVQVALFALVVMVAKANGISFWPAASIWCLSSLSTSVTWVRGR